MSRQFTREEMRLYMLEWRRGKRRKRKIIGPEPTPPDTIDAIKQYLRSAERLRTAGVKLT